MFIIISYVQFLFLLIWERRERFYKKYININVINIIMELLALTSKVLYDTDILDKQKKITEIKKN